MSWTGIVLFIQLFFGIVIGLYFWNLLRNQRTQKVTIDKESKKEMEALRKMRSIKLSEPLSERVRPKGFQDIVGQEDGIRALKAALCGPNPQHVIVYGPPGVGKQPLLVLSWKKRNVMLIHRLRKMRYLWSSMPQPQDSMNGASQTHSLVPCMTRFTKGRERWTGRHSAAKTRSRYTCSWRGSVY